MLDRLKVVTARRVDVAFESTLASRTFAPWIRGLVASGYRFHLFFFYMRSPESCIERVKDPSGKVSSWAIEIASPNVLRRADEHA